MRADIEPFFDLAGVLFQSCALSLPHVAHEHIGQSNAIDVRLLSSDGRHEPLHHGLVHAHRVVLRPSGNVGHACPTIGAWRSTLPWDMSSFGFAGQSITAACSVMLAGPALSAFAIFHSSECADVVNVLGGNGAVAEERSSAKAIEEIAANPIAA